MIVQFSGAVSAIPAGYSLCDGTNGTPDLRTKFVVGAGGGFAVGNEGGSYAHTHPFTGDGHAHIMVGGADITSGPGSSFQSSVDPTTGTTVGGPTVGPWYALAYIMETG